MNRFSDSSLFLRVVCAVVLGFGLTVVAASTADLKSSPGEADEPAAAAEEPAGQADSGDESGPGVCVESEDRKTVSVNTLEDVFAISSGNLATFIEQATKEASEKTEASSEEVRWLPVDDQKEPKQDSPETVPEDD